MGIKEFRVVLGAALLLCPGIVLCDAPGNAQAAGQTPPTVSMSQGSGIYAGDFTLTLDSQGASAVYYTLDGSDPTESATRAKYQGPLSIADRSGAANYVSAVPPEKYDAAYATWDSQSQVMGDSMSAPKDEDVDKGTVVKAVAVDASGNYGPVCTNTYFVGTVAEHIQGAKESAAAAGMPLAVISISVDYEDLFDYEKGIYVRGKVFDQELQSHIQNDGASGVRVDDARNYAANYSQKGREWERNAHIDYFETDGTAMNCKLQQDCGIRIQGNYSRSDLMKGLRLYARADYGEKNFRYPFFPDAKDDSGKVIDKYKKLVLRNGGNYAFYGTKYNDTYWQSMLSNMKCETQSSRPCVVYIDGEYWGLYLLQQDYDDNYFEETHGVFEESVVVYKASDAWQDSKYGYKLDEGTLPQGVTETDYFYKDLLKFFETHEHLVNKSDYQAFAKLVDPQSVMDYFAVNVWINNKWDWPGKNWSMWKADMGDPSNPYADGRWRFCFYDLDFGGCGGSGEIYTNTIKDDNYNTNGKGLLGQNTKAALNPGLQCFILLMTNQNFREAFKKELLDLANTAFEEKLALQKLEYFRQSYEPLYSQFYTRYFGKNEASGWVDDTYYGYAGYQFLKDFVKGREKGIPGINSWVDDYFEKLGLPAPTEEPSDQSVGNGSGTQDKKPAAVSKKKIKKLTVTARRGKKTIQVKTLAKAKVKISLKKKMIIKGKKKYKTITVKASKKGVVKIRLSKKLARKMRVTVKVSKSGYKTKSKTIKVK